jgi:ElaB/YqjD/DUF883 family membrane-anchored ribosome-binding protein
MKLIQKLQKGSKSVHRKIRYAASGLPQGQVGSCRKGQQIMNPSETRISNGSDWQEPSPSASEKSAVTNMQKSLSHKLTDAANALREKSEALGGNNREIASYGNTAAEWLDRSANYVEEFKPQQLKSDLERQVRDHPGRSLLIATAAGLVIGSLFRRR